jgi:hypothetical protein
MTVDSLIFDNCERKERLRLAGRAKQAKPNRDFSLWPVHRRLSVPYPPGFTGQFFPCRLCRT